MAWVTSKEPPKEAETKAGVIKITTEERPIAQIIKTSLSMKIVTDGERKETAYHIFLTRPGSPEEKEIGHAEVLYRKVSDIKHPMMHAILANAGLKDDDKIAMINKLYPITFEEKDTPTGKQLVLSDELSRKGIGRAVLADILERCRSEGAAAAYCCTKNPVLRHMLDKSGFQRTEYFYLKTL